MPSRIRIILLDFTRNGTRVTDRNREVETKKEINGERERDMERFHLLCILTVCIVTL